MSSRSQVMMSFLFGIFSLATGIVSIEFLKKDKLQGTPSQIQKLHKPIEVMQYINTVLVAVGLILLGLAMATGKL